MSSMPRFQRRDETNMADRDGPIGATPDDSYFCLEVRVNNFGDICAVAQAIAVCVP